MPAPRTAEATLVAVGHVQDQVLVPTESDELGVAGPLGLSDITRFSAIIDLVTFHAANTKIDVTLEGRDPTSGKWVNIATLAQKAAAGTFNLDSPSPCPYKRTRVKRVVSGGTVTQGAVTIDPAGANNRVDFTAVPLGAAGNGIRIRYLDPGAINQALSCTVAGTDITVNLATNGAGVITTIANGISGGGGIIATTPAAAALVTAANGGGDSGVGVVTAMGFATIAGGDNPSVTGSVGIVANVE